MSSASVRYLSLPATDSSTKCSLSFASDTGPNEISIRDPSAVTSVMTLAKGPRMSLTLLSLFLPHWSSSRLTPTH